MTTAEKWRQAAIDCVDLYGGTVAEYLAAVPGIERKMLRVNHPGRKYELGGIDDTLSQLEAGLTRLERFVPQASVSDRRRIRRVVKDALGILSAWLGNDPVDIAQQIAVAFMDTPEGSERYKSIAAPGWIVDLSQEVAHACGLTAPQVKLFRRARFDEAADFKQVVGLTGTCKPNYQEIYIRDGLSKYETAITVGHEIYHLFEEANGLTPNDAPAERYGLRVAESIYGSFA